MPPSKMGAIVWQLCKAFSLNAGSGQPLVININAAMQRRHFVVEYELGLNFWVVPFGDVRI